MNSQVFFKLARVNGKVIDERIYEWFANTRRNIPVSSPILQTKALQVAASIALNDFRASNGWLEAFRQRPCIQFRLLSRESIGMDENVVNHLKQNLPNIIQGYDTTDIYERGQNWTSLERCAKPQLGIARRKVQSKQAGQGETYHCSSLFNN